MTIHSRVKHKCEHRGITFVRIPESPECPKCRVKADVLFPDFIKDTLESVEYNLSHYGMFVKMWSFLTVGDFYYFWAFRFLDYVCSQLKVDKYHLLSKTIPKAQVDSLTSQFLNQLKYKDSQDYWKHGLKPYLLLLLQTNNT